NATTPQARNRPDRKALWTRCRRRITDSRRQEFSQVWSAPQVAAKDVAVHGGVFGTEIRTVSTGWRVDAEDLAAADRFQIEELGVDVEWQAFERSTDDVPLGVEVDPPPHRPRLTAVTGPQPPL